jgi:hypothetical protein
LRVGAELFAKEKPPAFNAAAAAAAAAAALSAAAAAAAGAATGSASLGPDVGGQPAGSAGPGGPVEAAGRSPREARAQAQTLRRKGALAASACASSAARGFGSTRIRPGNDSDRLG